MRQPTANPGPEAGGRPPHPARGPRRPREEGGAPDVEAFLARAGPLSAAELAAVLRVDQRQRWQAGQRVPAERYLSAHPELRADPEAALDLIFNEYLLLAQQGEQPDPEEF